VRYRNIVTRLISKPLTFVITAQSTEVFDATGSPTGIFRPKWMKRTPYWVDIVIEMEKRFERKSKKVEYVGRITKCRFQRAFEKEIPDLTYDKLVKCLREELGVKLI